MASAFPPVYPPRPEDEEDYFGFIPKSSPLGTGITGGGWAIDKAAQLLKDNPSYAAGPLVGAGYNFGKSLLTPRPKPTPSIESPQVKALMEQRRLAAEAAAKPSIAKAAPLVSRAGELDRAEADYNQDPRDFFRRMAMSNPDMETKRGAISSLDALSTPEQASADRRERLGFSWGGNVPLGDNGKPTIDSPRGRESVGGGGYTPSADVESMPLGQRPESYFQDRQRALGLRGAEADVAQREAAAADPYKLREFAGRQSIEAAVALDKQRKEREQALKYLAEMDTAIDAETQSRIEAAKNMHPAVQKEEIESAISRGQQAKAKLRQDYQTATGKVSVNYQPDRPTFNP